MRTLALGVLLRALTPTAAAATPALDPALAQKALCAGPCAVLMNTPVGQDGSGRALVLVGVASPRNAGERLPRSENDADKRCLAEPYALLHVKNGNVEQTEPIVTLRAKGCGRDREELRLSGDKVIYDVQGGQQWTYVELTTWQLAPVLRVVERYEEKFAHEGAPGQTVDRQLDANLVTVERRLPFCGEVVHADGHEAAPHATLKYDEIPLAQTPGDWKAPGFSPAALDVDATGQTGFILLGNPGAASDAHFRAALLAPDTLWIELQDDHLVETGGDAFELAWGEALPPFPSSCVPNPGAKRPPHDGGKVELAELPAKPSRASTLQVERAGVDGKLRLLVHLPSAPGSLCLVYDDSDDGKTTKQRLGTCTLKPDEPLSLGAVGAGRSK
ncbi:MAG: hypothetical protein JST54_26045 [Deltaproteobacteria bacterium]|nr:hypothetical protein [Deltaproteobacteria bacterium]